MNQPFRHLRSALLPGFVALLGVFTGPAGADTVNSREYIEKSVAFIQAGDYSLARTYLRPALIDPKLNAGERSRAYYLNGYSYYAGGLVVSAGKDYARSLEFNPSNAAALVALGGLYHRGEGVEEDAELAFAFFESATELGHPEGQLFLGYALLMGLGTEPDLERAREVLARSAESGDTSAMVYLGRSYRKEFADPPDPEQARVWYDQAREAGDIDATVALGHMHYKGEFGEADYQLAAELFETASEAGSSAGDVALGHMYLVGDGVPTDPSLARELLERAAVAGNLGGTLSLGHMFEAGIGVKSDLDAAQIWYRKGAEAGFGQAQLRLFYVLFQDGRRHEAAEWLARAAEQDLPQAQNDYAWILSTSTSDEMRDGELALTYAERAVAQVRSPAYLDTLAAAYAELGRYPEAVTTQEQALALVEEPESEDVGALEDHLDAYRSGQPWRE